jgi:rare lipoprotein A (peptidoglycan hydrolase)
VSWQGPVEILPQLTRDEAAPVAAAASAPLPYQEVGVASWYGRANQGRRTASGQRFDGNKLTAAHRSLPLHTVARVTNLENGRSVEVTVNDRGPYVHGRVIDLSTRAAAALGMTHAGLAVVRIEAPPGETRSLAMDGSTIGLGQCGTAGLSSSFTGHDDQRKADLGGGPATRAASW